MRTQQQSDQYRLSCASMITLAVIILFSCSQKIVAQQWSTNGNDISNTNSGKVGIGTPSPIYSLDVNGGINGFRTKASTASADDAIAAFENSSGIQMILRGHGNVGIGTVSPGFRLDVQGGAVNAAGGLCIAGDCKTAWSQIGSQWTTSGSNIFYNSGNVGIGTTATPTRRLEVLGGNIFHQWSATPGTEHGFYTAINNNHFTSNLYFDGQWKMITTGKGAVTTVAPASGWAFSVWSDNTSRAANAVASATQLFTVTMGGSVGVGTATPGFRLDVQGGQVNASGGLCINGDCRTTWPGGGTSQWTTAGTNIFYNAGNVGIGTNNPLAVLDVRNSDGLFYAGFGFGANKETFIRAGSSTTGVLHLGDALTAKTLLQETGGSVGIGTSAPGFRLDVQGGQVNASGGLCIAGDCRTTWPGGTSQWTTVGTNIHYSSGNVGIGTATPAMKLHVSGDGKFTGSLTVDGNIAAKYQDVAEWVPAEEQIAIGTVVVLHTTKPNHVISSNSSYDTRVAGVISEQPGITLGEKSDNKVLVATTGRVKVKVDATNGPIRIGDLLVTSDREGFAMKSLPIEMGGSRMHRPGTLIGKALEPLAKGTGEILVLLSLQ